jgi:hypothetical protein
VKTGYCELSHWDKTQLKLLLVDQIPNPNAIISWAELKARCWLEKGIEDN